MSLNVNASIVLDKGLSNYLGHNNCFLNSAVQVFWHLQVFRKNFLAMKNHDCVEGSCIYCALQDIFKEFKESDENILNPDMLRLTLACSFQDQAKFQLGELDDAAECYEKILSRIHFHLSGGSTDDFCLLKHCITHEKFAMSLIQQSTCQCHATSEPFPYVQLVHYVSTSSIIECSKTMNTKDFSEILRCAFNQGSSDASCPLKCNLKCVTTRTLINRPDVVSIGLIWNSDQPDIEHIREFVTTIGTQITLHNLFDSAIEADQSDEFKRDLVGVVCYYFKHYSTFFKRSKDGMWISFDDASVTEIGETWDKVIDKCCRGKYQPLLLIYQNKHPSLIDTKEAPKKTTFIKKTFANTRSSMKMNRLKSMDLPVCDETSSANNGKHSKNCENGMVCNKEKKFKNLTSTYQPRSSLDTNGNSYPLSYPPLLLNDNFRPNAYNLNFNDTTKPVNLCDVYDRSPSLQTPSHLLTSPLSRTKDLKGMLNKVEADIIDERKIRQMKFQHSQTLPQHLQTHRQQQQQQQYCNSNFLPDHLKHHYFRDPYNNNNIYQNVNFDNVGGDKHSNNFLQSSYAPSFLYKPSLESNLHRGHNRNCQYSTLLPNFSQQHQKCNFTHETLTKFTEPPDNSALINELTYNSKISNNNNNTHEVRDYLENSQNNSDCGISGFENLSTFDKCDVSDDGEYGDMGLTVKTRDKDRRKGKKNINNNNNNVGISSNLSSSYSSYENIGDVEDFVLLSREDLTSTINLIDLEENSKQLQNEKIRALYKT